MLHNPKLKAIWAGLMVLVLSILACGPTPVVTQQPQDTPVPNNNNDQPASFSKSDLIAATVQIFGCHIQNGNISPFYVGSGSIISSDGLILTNAHVADPAYVGEADSTPDALVIGIVQSEDQPPVYSYRAEVKAIDGYMDLAVIQVYADLKGNRIDPASLHLPYIPVGDSDALHVTDHINIFGFPAIGGDTITYTSGNVSGFSAEENLGERAWIKTDATISGGNSGGMGANDAGQLIGVPSIASSGAANADATDCRVIQDTNGDGQLTNEDTCIPIGGFINALRPVNLAKPLIQAARSGMAYTSPFGGPDGPVNNGPSQPTGSEQIGDIAWYTVTAQNTVGQQVSSYPSGTTAIAAVFNFSGFSNGEPWGDRWTWGGQEVYSGSETWSKGASGTYGISYSEQGNPLADGTYHVEIYAGSSNSPLAQSDVVVGNGSSNNNHPSTSGGVQISGTITDESTGRPISGAYFIVLNPGVTYADWKNAGFDKNDVYSYTKTNSRGQYALPVKIARNVGYTVVASSDGYLDAYGDNLVWTDQDPSDYTMDVTLSQ